MANIVAGIDAIDCAGVAPDGSKVADVSRFASLTSTVVRSTCNLRANRTGSFPKKSRRPPPPTPLSTSISLPLSSSLVSKRVFKSVECSYRV